MNINIENMNDIKPETMTICFNTFTKYIDCYAYRYDNNALEIISDISGIGTKTIIPMRSIRHFNAPLNTPCEIGWDGDLYLTGEAPPLITTTNIDYSSIVI